MFDIRLELISSHCYHSGQQYFLPMVRESSEPQKIQDDDNEPLIFHQIGTNQPTVTLFCMDIPESWTSWYSYTTFHLNTPKYIEKDSKDNQVLSENEANHLVQMLDTSIVNSLSELGL
ncbi:hypothetical protein C9374_006350 [Naegleria lovaniensis]|uniref:Uncharacterized protein n=1 Tax=Naegleria lovaniensis TaxID=51637 RepID=A0AA88GI28_NAELO|nr:uncharacterized protein C9374_006350 [Naegleria lovaniensis]KAG2381361.1 hypothetical protein C9374_006350 [Naegleria lovaniensis]